MCTQGFILLFHSSLFTEKSPGDLLSLWELGHLHSERLGPRREGMSPALWTYRYSVSSWHCIVRQIECVGFMLMEVNINLLETTLCEDLWGIVLMRLRWKNPPSVWGWNSGLQKQKVVWALKFSFLCLLGVNSIWPAASFPCFCVLPNSDRLYLVTLNQNKLFSEGPCILLLQQWDK